MKSQLFAFILAFSGLLTAQAPVTFRLAGWNLEGNGNDISPARLEQQLAEKDGVDLWGLSEVRPELFERFRAAASEGEEADFGLIKGNTGSNIRLAILFDPSVLELLGHAELSDPVFNGHRRPLVGHFRGKRTGQEFRFVVNHLARGDAGARVKQAKWLNKWAKTETLPIIAVGDYNFDFDVEKGDFGKRDPGFDAMIADGVFEWVRPRVLVKTQADDQYRTVLDFVFVANASQLREEGWSGLSRILNREGDAVATEVDFDDNKQDTDHRPVDAILSKDVTPFDPIEGEPVVEGGEGPGGAVGGDLEARVRRLEERMARIEALLEELRNRIR